MIAIVLTMTKLLTIINSVAIIIISVTIIKMVASIIDPTGVNPNTLARPL